VGAWAIVKSAFKLIFQYVKRSRIRLSADRGFPDDDLFTLFDELKIDYTIRVKGSVKVFYRGKWVKPVIPGQRVSSLRT